MSRTSRRTEAPSRVGTRAMSHNTIKMPVAEVTTAATPRPPRRPVGDGTSARARRPSVRPFRGYARTLRSFWRPCSPGRRFLVFVAQNREALRRILAADDARERIVGGQLRAVGLAMPEMNDPGGEASVPVPPQCSSRISKSELSYPAVEVRVAADPLEVAAPDRCTSAPRHRPASLRIGPSGRRKERGQSVDAAVPALPQPLGHRQAFGWFPWCNTTAVSLESNTRLPVTNHPARRQAMGDEIGRAMQSPSRKMQ